ncbi:hypothetical protein [Nocardioides iriomotensis]|uniref:Uncharacterized protein n=1 Tax=Nocardioides iriomotensis TaxID=715784 RepID=A0A4V1Z211_9ACTN|nr:hypothetical protein [Nocardioides iriomotensis]RYU12786.1 hypothetical protein ETU37_07370 [Nocardioides iriomotensis]
MDPVERRRRVTITAGGVGFVVGCGIPFPWLASLYGPFGERGDSVGFLVALTVGGGLAVVLAASAWLGAARSQVGTWLGLVALVAVGVVLWPVGIDRTDSFVARSARTATCRGWAVDYYPPGTMDGSSTEFCVGLEDPVDAP